MTKLSRAFTIVKPQFSLLKTVTEAGLIDKLRGKSTPEPEHSVALDVDTSHSKLELIAGQAIRAKRGTARWIILVNNESLSTYVSANGGKQYLTTMTDPELEDLLAACKSQFTNFKSSTIVKLPENFSFSEQVKPEGVRADNAVLLDVPLAVQTKLSSVKSIKELQEPLTALLSHRNYVMTIALAAAARIAPEIDDAEKHDPAALEKVFDIRIVKYYPVKTAFNAAVARWHALHSQNTPKDAGMKDEPDSVEHGEQLMADNPPDREGEEGKDSKDVYPADAQSSAKSLYDTFVKASGSEQVPKDILDLARKIAAKADSATPKT